MAASRRAAGEAPGGVTRRADRAREPRRGKGARTPADPVDGLDDDGEPPPLGVAANGSKHAARDGDTKQEEAGSATAAPGGVDATRRRAMSSAMS